MAEFTFYTNPMSRGQISRWALHEAGADYDAVEFDWDSRPAELAKLNPMNKVPVLVHHHANENGGAHDHVVTECAAINHYLAETHPQAGLLPDADPKANDVLEQTVQHRRRLEQQIQEIAQEQSRMRENMGRLAQNSELYNRYVRKLDQQETELDKIRKDIETLKGTEEQQRKELNDYLMGLDIG